MARGCARAALHPRGRTAPDRGPCRGGQGAAGQGGPGRRRDVALIGFHGQTILHRPEQHWTWQIGDGALLARLTGIDVVNDFRSADVKAGGQGAPLDAALSCGCWRPQSPGTCALSRVVVVNIGGVAKVTYISGDLVLAFDTGPGNAPIDDWMQRHTRQAGRRGRRLRRAPARSMTRRWTRCWPMLSSTRVPPKSLDRMDFGMDAVEGLSPADGAATLTAFTAASLARAREHFPEPADDLDRLRRRAAQQDADGRC